MINLHYTVLLNCGKHLHFKTIQIDIQNLSAEEPVPGILVALGIPTLE